MDNKIYRCDICNYDTHVRTALYNHRKTKKHIQKQFKLEKKCINEKQTIDEKNKEIEDLKQKLIEAETKAKLIEAETKAKIYKELSEKPKNINNGIIINNNLNYVNKHFKDAPPLRKISNYTLNGLDLEDDSLADEITENIIYSYKNKCLHKLIGDHIIKNYKKDDLSMQSFHATDVARRKYLVKLEDKMSYLYDSSDDQEDSDIDDEYYKLKKGYKNKKTKKNTTSKWTHDNEGIKISYLLFEPVIKRIIRRLKKKCNEYHKEIKKSSKKIPTREDIEKFEVLNGILKEIDSDKIKKNINNYIAPHFGLDRITDDEPKNV